MKFDSHYEISIYKGEMTKEELAKGILKIKATFNDLPKEFYAVFSERLKANGFSNDRLKDSINHVIDNCIYPKPTIAQFISFDKRVKLYSYSQVLQFNKDLAGKAFEYYRPVSIKENQKKPIYAHINDVENYNLKLWENEKKRRVNKITTKTTEKE